jgi:hypothetical protein
MNPPPYVGLRLNTAKLRVTAFPLCVTPVDRQRATIGATLGGNESSTVGCLPHFSLAVSPLPCHARVMGSEQARQNGRHPIPPALRRTVRYQITVTERDAADLERIGEAWGVPAVTALYFLAAGRLAELRGETLSSSGGDLVRVVGEWLRGLLPGDPGS